MGHDAKRIKVGVFYSLGPHLYDTVQRVRREWPEGTVTLYYPPRHTLSDEAACLVDEVAVTEFPHYSPRNVGACRRLVRQIRAKRFDRFVVMFDSAQLRVLGALSGARATNWCLPGGHLKSVSTFLPGIIAGEMFRRLWGTGVYTALWVLVRILRVKPIDQRGSPRQ